MQSIDRTHTAPKPSAGWASTTCDLHPWMREELTALGHRADQLLMEAVAVRHECEAWLAARGVNVG